MLETVVPYVVTLLTKIMCLFSFKHRLEKKVPTYLHVSNRNELKVAFLLKGVKNIRHVDFYFHEKRLFIKSFVATSWGLDPIEAFADLPSGDYSSASTETCFDNDTGLFVIIITMLS